MMKFRQRTGKTWFAYAFVFAFVFAFAWPLVAGDDIMSSGELVFEMTAEKDGICCAWARISNNL